MAERERLVNVRMTDNEAEMVRAVAEHMGLSQSDTIRQLVRRAFEAIVPPKVKRRKRK
jgi:antitoxin component of RelBE/YafQ-DinJ toxin-antitoxin module